MVLTDCFMYILFLWILPFFKSILGHHLLLRVRQMGQHPSTLYCWAASASLLSSPVLIEHGAPFPLVFWLLLNKDIRCPWGEALVSEFCSLLQLSVCPMAQHCGTKETRLRLISWEQCQPYEYLFNSFTGFRCRRQNRMYFAMRLRPTQCLTICRNKCSLIGPNEWSMTFISIRLLLTWFIDIYF